MQPAVVRKLAGLLECILELLISVEHRRGENVVIMIHRVWGVVVVRPSDACALLDRQGLREL